MRKLSTAFVVSLSLVLGGFLYAQDEGDEVGEEVAKADGADPAETADVAAEERVELTPDEMTFKADELIKAMRAGLKEVIKVQKVARKQQDVIKLNCVNDKLLQVKQLMNIAEASSTDMVEAIAQQDIESTQHQFSQITIASEKTDGLRSEAEGCIGEELIFLGPTEVVVDDPGLQDDPTAPEPFNWYDIIEPPAYASPFL